MTTLTTEQTRDRFRELAMANREKIKAGDSDAANALADEAYALVQPIIDRGPGNLARLLMPLTDASEKNWVRYQAASLLLHHEGEEHAVPVLEDVRDNTQGMASMGAESVLRSWQKRQKS